MSLELIAWPYHAGLLDVSMGLGGSALLADAQLRSTLLEEISDLVGRTVAPVDEALPELARIFELDRRLAREVADARTHGRFPLVLAGNCISCLGTTAAINQGRDLGVVWLDAHADFDTPEDNLSGFIDVMGLATLTGGCWKALRETIPGFRVVPERDAVLAGVRDLEPYQRGGIASAARTIARRIAQHSAVQASARSARSASSATLGQADRCQPNA